MVLAIVLLVGCGSLEGGEPTSSLSATRPNILVLVADDAGWKDFGAYGDPVSRTPTIDTLAQGGLLFEQAMLTIPQCSPSRISILTGQYPHETKAEDLHMDLGPGRDILPAYLSEEGYYTGHMRKRHYGPEGDRQFDWYSEVFAEFGDFLDEAGDAPFFMWVGFNDPHRSYEPGAVSPPIDPMLLTPRAHLRDTPETRADIALYYEEIARLDQDIGSFMETLRERGLVDDTLVIFLSDNGAPFPREKGSLYDTGIATPLIMHWPAQIEAGQRYQRLASVVDLAPTLTELAGAGIPESFSGASIATVLAGRSAATRDYAFSERNWHNCDEHQRSIRTERYKLITNAYLDLPACIAADIGRSPSFADLYAAKRSGTLTPEQALFFQVPRPAVELYDLSTDPGEYNNIAGREDVMQVQQELLAELEAWIERTDDLPAARRRRGPNTDRWTGVKFTSDRPEMVDP